ncbi:MAG: N-acetylmuramoyl-L-alanine amidase, partial [Gammaproteobacteria bacterium]
KLSQRRRFADKMRADLFLSIHANSFSSTKVNGSAVYALSEKGASSAAAKALADKENAADLLGGVDLTDKDDLVKSVLMDLSQNATQQSSLQLAEKVLFGLGRVNKVHKQQVQTAGFVVLKSPSVPSVLVETAFISNPGEEKLLASAKGQKKLARAIFNGVENFVRQDMALRLANVKSSPSRSYEVQPGDTLSEVAQRHRVSLAQLRSANGIRGDRLLVGKKLVIPATHGG